MLNYGYIKDGKRYTGVLGMVQDETKGNVIIFKAASETDVHEGIDTTTELLTEEFTEWLGSQGLDPESFQFLPYEHQVEYILAYDLV